MRYPESICVRRSEMTRRESQDADFRGSNANFRGYTLLWGSRVLSSRRTAAIRENPRAIRGNQRPRFFGKVSAWTDMSGLSPESRVQHQMRPMRRARASRTPFTNLALCTLP